MEALGCAVVPSTTLFRSFHGADDDTPEDMEQERLTTITLPFGARALGRAISHFGLHAQGVRVVSLRRSDGKAVDPQTRSEEHTSELQSRRDLVCRLLPAK